MSTDNTEVPLLLTAERADVLFKELDGDGWSVEGLKAIAQRRAIVVRADELRRIIAEMRGYTLTGHGKRWADALERAMGGGE